MVAQVTIEAANQPREYRVVEGLVGGAIINGLLNAWLGHALLPNGQALSMFALPGIAADVVAMAFGIAFGTGLILTPQLRKQKRAGKLTRSRISPLLQRNFATWPEATLQRAFNLGVLSVLLFAPLTVLGLWLWGPATMDQDAMTWMKGVFGAVVGGAVTPVIALGALFSPQSK